jgi:hypothetical protein
MKVENVLSKRMRNKDLIYLHFWGQILKKFFCYFFPKDSGDQIRTLELRKVSRMLYRCVTIPGQQFG